MMVEKVVKVRGLRHSSVDITDNFNIKLSLLDKTMLLNNLTAIINIFHH